MNCPSCVRSAPISSPMLAPAPRPNLLPVRMTPTRGVLWFASAIAAVAVRRSATAACESVFMPPESNVTQAIPFRMSCVIWLMVVSLIGAGLTGGLLTDGGLRRKTGALRRWDDDQPGQVLHLAGR